MSAGAGGLIPATRRDAWSTLVVMDVAQTFLHYFGPPMSNIDKIQLWDGGAVELFEVPHKESEDALLTDALIIRDHHDKAEQRVHKTASQ